MGQNALVSMQSGDNNTAIGFKALEDNNEDAINRNTAVGCNAALNLSTAIKTVAIGDDAIGIGITTGDKNVAVGQGAGYALIAGHQNVLIGADAGVAITSGRDNVVIGTSAGSNDVNFATGDQCTIIGSHADTSATNSSNQIAIGYDVTCIANSTVTIGIGSSTASLGLDGSDTSWAAASSDERYKENITTSTAGLSFVNDLRPVTYNWKKAKDVPSDMPAYKEGSDEPVLGHEYGETLHGFIAQEVKAAVDGHSEIKEGFKMWKLRDDGVQTVADGNLVPMLVKAVQELSQQVEDLKKQINK